MLGSEEVKKLDEAMDVLIKSVNNYNSENRNQVVKLMADKFIDTHNTLQQSLMRMCFELICEISRRNPSMDLRNQNTMEFIHGMAKQELYFPLI